MLFRSIIIDGSAFINANPPREPKTFKDYDAEDILPNGACPLQRSGAARIVGFSFSMKLGVDARVGHCGSVHERQRPVSLKMDWKPPLRAAVVDTHG